jgi:hypothetical protein
LSSDEDSKKNEAPSPIKLVIRDFTGNNISLRKGAASEKELVINPPPADKPPSELAYQMTLEDMWSSKDPGTHKMLKAFLATTGYEPKPNLQTKQKPYFFKSPNMARSKPNKLKSPHK